VCLQMLRMRLLSSLPLNFRFKHVLFHVLVTKTRSWVYEDC
jgi:hypothetical protein